jgi:hypothetical protein
MSSPEFPIGPDDNAVVRRDIQLVEAPEIDGVQVTVQANGRGHKIALVAVAAGSRIIKYAPEVDEVAREIFSLGVPIASCVEIRSDDREFALTYKIIEPIGPDCFRDRHEWQIRKSG